MSNQNAEEYPKFHMTSTNDEIVRQTLNENYSDPKSLHRQMVSFFTDFNFAKAALLQQKPREDDEALAHCLVALGFISSADPKQVASLKFSETKITTIVDFLKRQVSSNSNTQKKLYFFAYFYYIRKIVDYRKEDLMGKQIADKLTKFFKSSTISDELAEDTNINGSYTIFRPAPYDPLEEVLCSTLLVGEGSVAGKALKSHECAVISDLESHPHGVPRDLKGFHSVMDHSVIMMLRNPYRTDARFVYYVHHIDFFDNKYPNMRGIVTVDTAHKHSASAWPFVAINNTKLTEQERIVGVKPFAEIGSRRLQDLVKSELERGAVYWNRAHYPKHMDFANDK